MQIVFFGDNLHETPTPVFWEKIRKISSSSTDLAQTVEIVYRMSVESVADIKKNSFTVTIAGV